MSKTKTMYEKKSLASYLNVSMRTLNRYIQKYKLIVYTEKNTKKVDIKHFYDKYKLHNSGQVGTQWDSFKLFELDFVKKKSDKSQLENIGTRRDKPGQAGTNFVKGPSSREKKSYVDNRDKSTNEFENNAVSSLQIATKESKIYKDLYQETLKDLKQKQERLEGATYRVGQLEAQIKNSVPLLSYRQKEEEVIQLHEIQKKESKAQQEKVLKLETEKAEMQIVKNLYLILLFSFVIFSPLFLIYFLSQS